MVDPVNTIVENFQSYRGKYNINSVLGGLLLYLSESGLGGSATGGATELKQDQLITSLNNLLAENATDVAQEQIRLLLVSFLAENATEAKQDAAIALLTAIDQKLTVTDPVIQPIVDSTIGTSAADIASANSNRKVIYLHNNSSTNTLIVNFGEDASSASAIYRVIPEQTLIEKDSIIKLRISAIASSGTVAYTYREGL